MKRYELRIVLDNGRVIHGPVFSKDDYNDFENRVKDLDEVSLARLRNGSHFFVVPKEMLQRIYVEIRRIGLLRRLISWWRR